MKSELASSLQDEREAVLAFLGYLHDQVSQTHASQLN